MMCDLNVIYQSGKEYSLEELRCQAMGFSYDSLRKPATPEKPLLISQNKTNIPSPTINTKAAMQDVFDMFNQPIADAVWQDEDETISAKVYKPEAFKIGVFKDEEDEGHSEEALEKEETVAEQRLLNPTKTPKMPPVYPIQSTPLVGAANSLSGPSFPSTVVRPGIRHFDVMTPITEVSEDRTFAGLSTIKSDKNLATALSSISCEDSTGSMKSFLSRSQSGLIQSNSLLEQLEKELDDLGIENSHPSSFQPAERPRIEERVSQQDEEQDVMDGLETMELPNPCNPRDPQIIAAILASVKIPKNSGLVPLVDVKSDLMAQFKKALSVKKSKTRLDDFEMSAVLTNEAAIFELPELGNFKLLKKLGEGSYGAVYLVRILGDAEKTTAFSYFGDEEDIGERETIKDFSAYRALKLEIPPAPWEFYITSVLRARLATSRVTSSIVKPTSCHLFKNESILLMEYIDQGTLLNCVNLAQKGGFGAGVGQTGLDELLAVFWTIEILKIVETVHATGVMHGDIKVSIFYRLCTVKAYDTLAGQLHATIERASTKPRLAIYL